MKVCIMTGARPNFIKVAPLIKAICKAEEEGEDISYQLVFAGSEGNATLESSLFDDLQMPRPDVFLGVDASDTNTIISEVTTRFGEYVRDNEVDVVIVVDDLASTMAASIVAKKRGIRLAHLVAGTRSFDINMPKEINRLVIDGLSDLLFTAGSSVGTKADPQKIYVVGNILIDTLRNNIHRLRRPEILDTEKVGDGEYVVLTINRKALLANEENLRAMLEALSREAGDMKVIAPLRGEGKETVARLAADCRNIVIAEPLPYLEFGYLTMHARCIVTDSGNVAEEATFNGVPCITLNNYTEHIETVKQGTNVLVNEDAQLLAQALRDVFSGVEKNYSIPDMWDGRTAERIVKIL